MRYLLVFALLALANRPSLGEEPEMYSTKFDNMDIQQVLQNKRILKMYVNCVLGKGKCTEDGQFVKDNLEDILLTNCERCSDKQKENAKMITKYFIEHERGYTMQFREKFDPDGRYWEHIKVEAAKAGYTMPYDK